MTYAQDALDTREAIEEAGGACTWHSATVVVDDASPWNEVPSALTPHSHFIVVLPFDSYARMFGYAAGQAVPAGTELGLMAGHDDFTPTLRDTVTVGMETYSVKAFKTINPDGATDILYLLELRR